MTVRVVIQRCESAKLLVDNEDEWVHIGNGLIIYIVFLKGTTPEEAKKAADKLLKGKLVPLADGSGKLGSILAECADVLVVPQASLAGKLKGNGVQYHDRGGSEVSSQLYDQFTAQLKDGIENNPLADKPRDPKFACGVFGNRQGLEVVSRGPYSHFFDL